MKDFLDKVVNKEYSELEPFIASRTGAIIRDKIDAKKTEFVAKASGETKVSDKS